MQEARFPEDDASRVATLQNLGILDTPRNDRFDHYTRITARIFEMPIALISLVDSDRQWFKSAEGLDVHQTPRDISFCGHAILGDGVFEVRDAQRDPRFRDNPLVLSSPNIRFYAGAPLKAPNRHKLGTLCVIDRVPRQLSADDKSKLSNLADMVVDEILKTRDKGAPAAVRAAETTTAAEFFSGLPTERGLSVLLFDIDDVLAANDQEHPDLSPGRIFANLLHDHFPAATSIAHVGDYHYCVLLQSDANFDEVRAISRVCSDARKLLCFAAGHASLTPYVGRIEYDSGIYSSVDDMRVAADRMFRSHEAIETPEAAHIKNFLKEMVGWRKTIF